MLAVVLLHMVEAARPIDLALHKVVGERGGQHVPHHAIFRLHIQHGHAAKHASIGGLAAALGIKCALIERDRRLASALGPRNYMRAKLRQVGIGKI